MLSETEKRNLANPRWRYEHLYSIVSDDGIEQAFVPTPEQLLLFSSMSNRQLVLKARQLGFTTAIDIIALDQCLFNANYSAVIICDSLSNSEKIFRNKVRRVYQQMPKLIQDLCPIVKETSSELVFSNGSSICVTTSARSGTVNFLHVSEMGKISRKYPHKAREIVTGSFEAVPIDGIIIVESTAEGKAGWFFDAVMLAHRRQQQSSAISKLDFALHFAPWYVKPAYTLDPVGIFETGDEAKYLDSLPAKIGRALAAGQRAWWVKKSATLGGDMKREYPSTVDEAFEVSIDGLIFGKEMALLRSLGRIGSVPLRAGIKVNTFWDLGVNDQNTIWLHQRVGATNRFIKYFWGANEGLAYYWQLLQAWQADHDAVWGTHYLPHDADTRVQGAELFTKRQVLEELGARNIVIVPRVADLRQGIEATRRMLPECEFDEAGCVDGLIALDNYSRDWNEDMGSWSDRPRHDQYSHGADAMRQFAQHYSAEAANFSRPVLPQISYGRGGY